jgi:TPR repeat protein
MPCIAAAIVCCAAKASGASTGGHWLRGAALQGEVDACYELGLVYFVASVRQSLRLAAKWLRAAAQLGHPGARAFLDRLGVATGWIVRRCRRGSVDAVPRSMRRLVSHFAEQVAARLLPRGDGNS